MKFHLLPLHVMAVINPSLFAAGELRPIGRAGLFEDEFAGGVSQVVSLKADHLIGGHSSPPNSTTQAAWITKRIDGGTQRVGLFTGADFVRTGFPRSRITYGTQSGWMMGVSEATPQDRPPTEVPWVVNGATGLTQLAGHYGPQYHSSVAREVNNNGLVWGVSYRFNGLFSPNPEVWVLDGNTPISRRVGLFTGAQFTHGESKAQESEGYRLTESGWLTGRSRVYSELGGEAIWVANAANGITKRVGLYTGAEYGQNDGSAISTYFTITESGFVAGTSFLYSGDRGMVGNAAWVANAATGVTKRVGLFGGTQYTGETNSHQDSSVRFITESGWVGGDSQLFDASNLPTGTAAWAADAATGTTRRVGLYIGPEFSLGDIQSSTTGAGTENGWISGTSLVFAQGSGRSGTAAWVADAATGTTKRIGFFGPAHTSSLGQQDSVPFEITKDGWLTGRSRTYTNQNGQPGTVATGTSLWVADAATGATRPVGFTGGEFVSTLGFSESFFNGLPGGGNFVFGYSLAYNGAEPAGPVTWVAEISSGVTRPVGLTGGEFIRPADKKRESRITNIGPKGYVSGISTRYVGGAVLEGTPWIADLLTWQTHRPSPSEAEFTRHDGYQAGRLFEMTNLGLAAGTATRFHPEGSIAWAYDMNSGIRTIFDFPVIPGGIKDSTVNGVTPGGIVHGSYTFTRNGNPQTSRAFIWAADLGTVLLDEDHSGQNAGNQWEYLETVAVTGTELITGTGKPADSGGTGVYFAGLHSSPDPEAGVMVTGLSKISENRYRLSFRAAAQVRITLQTSSDLNEWEDSASLDAPVGESSLEVAGSPDGNRGYWRLRTF